MFVKSLKAILYKMRLDKVLSRRRLRFIDRLLQDRLFGNRCDSLKVLDIGCATGKDFVRFFQGREDINITGLDLKDYGLRQANFRMVVGDAEKIEFADKYFDLAVSIGVFEHIKPIEKLAQVIEEIDRIAKSYVVIVPAITTLVEPHSARFLWQLRDHNKKSKYPGHLNYMSDEAWLSFKGFSAAKVARYSHIPLFLRNLVIYKGGGA